MNTGEMTVTAIQRNLRRTGSIAPPPAPELPALSFPGIAKSRQSEPDSDREFRAMHESIARMRRQMQSLRETEKQHRLLFERSPNPKFVCDARTLRILTVNDAAIRRYGYTREELLGLTARNLSVGDDFPAFLHHWRTISSRRYFSIEEGRDQFRHVKHNGVEMDVAIRVAVVPFEGNEALLVMAQDITEQKRAERRMRTQHATTRALAESATLAEASPQIFQAICENLGCDWAELWRVSEDGSALRCVQTWSAAISGPAVLDVPSHRRLLARGEGIPGMVWHRNKPVWIKDLAQETHLLRQTPAIRLGVRTAFAFPIRLNKEVLGVIAIFSKEMRGPDKHLLQMLKDITSQVGQVMGRRRVERQLLEVSEREQQRIGQDLHDGLCQQLAGVAYLADNLQTRLASKSSHEATAAARIHTLLQETIVQARQLARGLNPVRLEAMGLMAALHELASNIESLFSISCRFDCYHRVLFHNHENAVHLYRIAQEAIHNAIRHGKATQIVVALARKDDKLILSVRDNGRGISQQSPRGDGRGFENMRYRARTIGAQLQWDPRSGGGTIVACTLPSHKERQL